MLARSRLLLLLLVLRASRLAVNVGRLSICECLLERARSLGSLPPFLPRRQGCSMYRTTNDAEARGGPAEKTETGIERACVDTDFSPIVWLYADDSV